jgi:hypothetical protein
VYCILYLLKNLLPSRFHTSPSSIVVCEGRKSKPPWPMNSGAVFLIVQSVQSGVWTGPGLPPAVQSVCLTWPDQSSVHLGLDGLQETQTPELHSKILCNLFYIQSVRNQAPSAFCRRASSHHNTVFCPASKRFSNASGLLLGGSEANQIDSRRVLVNHLQRLLQIWILLMGFRRQLGWDGAVKERAPMGGDGE